MRVRTVMVEATNTCNLRCPQCWGRSMDRPDGFMAMGLFRKVVDEAATLPHLRTLSLHFNGESTTHPRFVEMLELLRGRGFPRVEYTTNGMDISDEVLRATVLLPVSHVHFSAHVPGGRPAEAASRLRTLREEHGQGPRITANVCWQGQGASEMNVYYDKWRGVADKFSLSGTVHEMQWTHLPRGYTEREQPFCSQPFRFVAVLWDGRVTVCCHDLRGELARGDVNVNSIVDTLHEPPFVRLREQIQTQTTPKGCLCTRCGLWQTRYQFPTLKTRLPEDELPGIALKPEAS